MSECEARVALVSNGSPRYIHTWMYTYVPDAYIHTQIHTCIHTYTDAYIHTTLTRSYTHAYTHTHLHYLVVEQHTDLIHAFEDVGARGFVGQ